MRALALGVLCGWCVACSGREAGRDAGARSLPADAAAPLRDVPAAKRPEKPARTLQIKEAKPSSEQMRPGVRVASPHAFTLPADGELTLDFDRGARVRLMGPGAALADLTDLDQLLLRTGLVSVDLSPSAPTPHSGFVLFTPSAKLTLVRGGRYALRVDPDGVTRGVTVSGSVVLDVAAESEADAHVVLGPGERFRVDARGQVERTRERGPTLAEAEAAVTKLAVSKGAPLDADVSRSKLEAAEAALAPLLARQQALVAAHRAALRDAGSEVSTLQRELAENAALVSRARARLRLVLGLRAAAELTPCEGGDDEASQRARTLLQH